MVVLTSRSQRGSTTAQLRWEPIPLVATKFAIPRRGGRLLRRARLLERLDEAAGHRVVAVVGPPGVGKTVLLTQWLAEPDAPPHAWLSLDAADNDPLRFWAHFLEALDRVRPGIGRRVASELPSAPAGRGNGFLTALVNDLAHIDAHCVLVLEDLHAISAATVIDRLAELVERLSGGLCIAISSRSEPRLPLQRLRVQGELVEIGSADLRFSLAETQALLGSLRGLQLDEADISLLHERTEGWVAALQLAALSLRRRGHGGDFIRSVAGSGRMIAEYLLAEVLDRQAPEVRDFLLTTAVLERMDPRLCDAVTGRRDSATMLRALDVANLFLESLDEEGESYRYHQLFRELLRHQLRLQHPEREHAIQLAAAACSEADGHLREAASYYIAAGDAEGALRALSASLEGGFSAMPPGAEPTWLGTVDEGLLSRSPERMITYALALMAEGRADAAVGWLTRAEADLEEAPADPATQERLSHAWIACHEIRGDTLASLGEARRLHAIAAARDDDGSLVRAFASVVRAHALLGDLDAAAAAYTSIPAAVGVPSRLRQVLVPGLYACVVAGRGRLREAQQLADQALGASTGCVDAESVDLIDPWMARAHVHLQRNRLEQAEVAARRACELAERGHRVAREVLARITLARVRFARGELTEVFDLLAGADPGRAQPPLSHHLWHRLHRAEAELWLRLGDVERAERLLASLPDGAARSCLAARIDLARGRSDLALTALAELRGPQPALTTAIVVRILVARALSNQDHPAALTELREAVELARPEGFVRAFVDEGPELTRLLRRLAVSDPSTYLAELVVAGEQPRQPALTSRRELLEPLSERELEVLRYLPTRLNNQEVAGELYVSLNTVKTHLKSIYRKLDAGSRSEAVLKARGLQLL